MATWVVALIAGTVICGQAQTLHISSNHLASRNDEKSYRTAFNMMDYVGTIGNKKYTLEVIKSWGVPQLEVGKDYTVVKEGSDSVKIELQVTRHGKEKTETLNLSVITIEEMASK